MHYYEIKISVGLKSDLHFQKSPQAISKLISTALIKGGYEEHFDVKVKNYVFSNLGKAKNGIYKENGTIYFRSFDINLTQMLLKGLFLNENDKIFDIKDARYKKISYRPITALKTLNPTFVKIKENGRFWTVRENGDIEVLLKALEANLIRKYESFFKEKLLVKDRFVEFLRIDNKTPYTFYVKKGRVFGNIFYLVPKDDEVSQKLAFTALANGLGHLNSSLGGGYCISLRKN